MRISPLGTWLSRMCWQHTEHESTGMTPNFVATGREVHAPVDLVYASYADELIDRMRRAHTLVREQLGVAAVRNKRNYDMRVRPQRYSVGQWVYYFNPRKIQGRQDKWRRKISRSVSYCKNNRDSERNAAAQ